MREIGIFPRFSRDKFVPLQTKQRYSTRDISGKVFLTLFFRGFVPFLSLADFVSRDKNLQVVDLQRLKSNLRGSVTATTRKGFSVNNITWLAASTDSVPVVYHKFDIDRKTGEANHTKREAELKDLTIHGQLQELKCREQDELKSALRKYGEEVDGGFEVHFEGERPIVAGYLFDEPCNIVIYAARVDAKGNLSLIGEDKQDRGEQYDIEASDIFGGQLDYVTSNIRVWR